MLILKANGLKPTLFYDMYVPVRAFIENHYKNSLNEGRTQWCKLSRKKPYDPTSCERKKELEKERQMVL